MQLLEEARRAGLVVEEVFAAADAPTSERPAEATLLATGVVERVASTATPQPVVAVVRRPVVDADVLSRSSYVLVADGVSDPGNLGTMLRSAEAAGVEVLVVTPGTTDPWSPKVVRSSAGSVFRVPVVEATLDEIRRAGLRLLGATSRAAGVEPYDSVDVSGRIAIVLGNESHGLRENAEVDEWVTIPHRGPAESLNVAMAATVLVFEATRRRRTDG